MRLLYIIFASLVLMTAAQAGRIELTGPTKFYVSTVGNDANDGLTPITPKQTTSAMLSALQQNYDFRCFDVQVVHAPSLTSYAPISVGGSFTGSCGQPLRIVGSTTRGAVFINATSDAIYASGNDTNVLIEGFSLQAGSIALHATQGAYVQYRDIEFQSATWHIACEKQARTYYLSLRNDGSKSNYFISGSAQSHLYVNGGGVSILTETVNGNGIQFIGSVNFALFANVIQGGNLTAHTNAWTGTVNNYPAIYVRWNSVGGIAGQIPGNQSLNNVDTSSTLIP